MPQQSHPRSGRLIRRAQRILTRAATGSDRVQSSADAINEYEQVEALMALHVLLTPAKPLPKTRGWAASADVLLALANEVATRSPKVIVEFGSGTSSVVLGLAARQAGGATVLSIDHDPVWAMRTRELVAGAGVSDLVTVIDAPLAPLGNASLREDKCPERWYREVELPTGIGLAFVDGPLGNTAMARYPALPSLASCLEDGAVVILDDADRLGEQAVVEAWKRRFPSCSFDQISAEKGAVRIVWRGPNT